MHSGTSGQPLLEPERENFYVGTLNLLNESGIPYLVGGAYALSRYCSFFRDTKDLDLFVRERDCSRILEELARHGYRTELTFPHWLGKAWIGDMFVDIIFSSGNAVAAVDEEWFDRAVDDTVLGVPVKLVPAEEIIWSKAFIMERERFDGSDLAHLFLSCAQSLDWNHLLNRFGSDWRLLFVHLILFGFVYPAYRAQIPLWVMHDLTRRLQQESIDTPPSGLLCQGTLLSRAQYLIDVNRWGFTDARVKPIGKMTREELDIWTAPILPKEGNAAESLPQSDCASVRELNQPTHFIEDQLDPPAA